jgi:hypothetical protein
MKHLPPSPSRHRLAVLAAAIGLAVLAAPAAHAFTIEDQSNTNSNGAARYTDPDARFSGFGSATTIQQGNTTIRYGGQTGSFDQRYDQNRMFQPNSLQGRDDR